ncbi:GNAT family N-acetyltransferase [Galbibacter sp. BG1]|uniref:GNAT family N-acetyltransferase n=1 Tax=Galbibacter sp. BG1 TaxID=1170699 RepID=UPI0015B93B02|nr:GNAT family N-acetyltransferase [Galbibacter sp. BG1]QLE01263.1 GNAT family N-acetyltransferase [Galbibacter sp. BG1]
MEEPSYSIIKDALSPDEVSSLLELYKSVFNDYQKDSFVNRLNTSKNLFALLVSVEDELIAFKIGYEMSPEIFYSWVGGVKPEWRRKGIAKKLQMLQEEYVAKAGYKTLRTKSTNKFKPMMQFNLKNGFDIVGVENSKNGLKVLFEKKIK